MFSPKKINEPYQMQTSSPRKSLAPRKKKSKPILQDNDPIPLNYLQEQLTNVKEEVKHLSYSQTLERFIEKTQMKEVQHSELQNSDKQTDYKQLTQLKYQRFLDNNNLEGDEKENACILAEKLKETVQIIEEFGIMTLSSQKPHEVHENHYAPRKQNSFQQSQ